MNISDYNLDTSEEKLVEVCQKFESFGGSTEKTCFLNYLLGLLSLKQQKKLLEEQKRANEKLVMATWVLAVATIITAIITKF